MEHTFDRAPSLPTLRKLITAAEKAGTNVVTFSYGEQCSTFTKQDGRWYHDGNGLLKAGYKLADALDSDAQKQNKSAWPMRF